MRNIFKALFVAMIIGLFIFRPTASYADWNGHDGHDGHSSNGNWHGHDGGHSHSFIGVNFSAWPNGYYYGPGYYAPSDEVLVSPPVYQPVVINGVTYYMCNGSYYIYNGYGYEPIAPPEPVVQQPQTVVEPPVVVDNQAAPASAPVITTADSTGDTPDSITINIPNDKGGFTAVTLKKSGNGYLGPQGEFYTEFPKVSQLRAIYGK